MLHERDALALDRLRDQDARSSVVIPELPKRDPQRRVVVAVAGHDAASERAQLGLEALEREYLLRRPVRLELVAVDDDEQPADALVRGRLERLPVLPLLSSPSPVITTTRPPRPRCRLAQAIPRALEMPIPSDPEFASIPGTPTSGWPSSPRAAGG